MDEKAKVRVTIAKDVIKWIENGDIRPQFGVYVSNIYIPKEQFTGKDSNKQLKDVVPSKCSVCAVGACFVTALDRYNDLTCNQFVETVGKSTREDLEDNSYTSYVDEFDNQSSKSYLSRFFSPLQIDMIEAAFEQSGEHCAKVHYDTDEIEESVRFIESVIGDGAQAWDADKSMILIMKNIIDNDGTFKP